MNAKTILFPTDFSPSSEVSLRYATSLARDAGARLLIVHVEEPEVSYGGGEFYVGALPNEGPDLAKMLEQVKPTDPAVSYEHRLLSGEPSHEIVNLAEQENADLIVLGTHGRTGLSRLLMGSVAEAVVRRAPCPVFTLKQPHDEDAKV
jgi:nucleotide-binding universal stress UspA family protein